MRPILQVGEAWRHFWRPRRFTSADQRLRFQAYFDADGLDQLSIAIGLIALGALLVYGFYGLTGLEPGHWFSAEQIQRLKRVVVLSLFLVVAIAFRGIWLKHWRLLAVAFVVTIYSLNVLALSNGFANGSTSLTTASGWQSVSAQVIILYLTFAFVRIPIGLLVLAAGISSSTLAFTAFREAGQIILASAALSAATIGGCAAWYNNYRRERDLFEQSEALADALHAAKKAQSLAMDLATQRRQLTRAVTHDIRQPMAAVGIQLSLLKNALREHAGLEQHIAPLAFALDALQSQVDEIAIGVLPDHIGDETNPAGTQRTLVSTDIAELLNVAVRLYRPLANQHGIELRVWSANTRPCLGVTSPGQLATVLQSLIGNAIKFRAPAPQRSHRITVGAVSIGNQIKLRVFDNGIGIPAHQLARIFDEGFSCAQDSPPAGTGLGLFNVRRLLQAMTGHAVAVTSLRQRYTCFSITLPATQETAQSAEAPATFAAAAAGLTDSYRSKPLSGRRLLVVEDDPLVASNLVCVLQAWGAEVVAHSSATVAIDHLQMDEQAIDGLVCDYNLGSDATGLDVIRDARNYYGVDIAALVFTGAAEVAEIAGAATAGGDRLISLPVLTKPVDPDFLLRTLLAELERAEHAVSV